MKKYGDRPAVVAALRRFADADTPPAAIPPFEFTARERWLSSLVLVRGRRVARELGVTDGELDALAAKVEAYREAGAPT